MSKTIYFDNAATTRMRDEVFEEMKPFLLESYGNPSSIYQIAKSNKKAIDEARMKIADLIGAMPEEIFFTGSGTEADNWAIKGIAEAKSAKGKHIITTAIEHHAVFHTCEYLEKKHGFEVTYLAVKQNGIINIEDFIKALRPDTILVSIMFANNEIGTIQPVSEIGKICREKGIVFHTDAVQALGHVEIDVNAQNIDLLSISAHKISGMKGVGALYIRKGINLPALIHGGGQEKGRRAGTENVAGIVAFGKACELVKDEFSANDYVRRLRNRLIDGVIRSVPHCFLNGDREKRLPGNANISFEFIEGESILLMLDMKGIFASSGSACTSGSLDPSHVLLAIGLPHEQAHGSLRLTLDKSNTEEEVDFFLAAIPPIIKRLRAMSPLYNEDTE